MFADGIGQSRSTDEEAASACPDWWEKSALNPNAKEGYPTQKPLALLHRIIAASTNPGRAVLNPFCGRATACIAAELAGECEWTGIDVLPKATELVRARMQREVGVIYRGVVRANITLRTDQGAIPPHNSPANRTKLYGERCRSCAGCGEDFKPQHQEVDHIIARNKGGTDHIRNRQLLYGNSNRIKGDRGMEYLKAKLQT